MTAAWAQEVERELVAGHHRLARRRHRRRRAATVTAVSLFGAIGFGVAPAVVAAPPVANASTVAIEHDGEGIRVDILDPDAHPDRIVDALRQSGVAIVVRSVLTGPSRSGEVLGLITENQAGTAWIDGQYSLRLSRDFQGRLVLLYGVRAAANSIYEQPTDPFAPGEPLEGHNPLTDSVDEIAAAAKQAGLNVMWIDINGQMVDDRPLGQRSLRQAMMLSDSLLALRVGR